MRALWGVEHTSVLMWPGPQPPWNVDSSPIMTDFLLIFSQVRESELEPGSKLDLIQNLRSSCSWSLAWSWIPRHSWTGPAMQKEWATAPSCPGMQIPRPLPLLSLLMLLLLGAGAPGAWGQAGSLDLQIDEEQPAGTLIGDISAGLPAGTAAPPMYFISAQEGSGLC